MGIVPLRGKTLKVESTRGRSRDILAEKEGNLKAEGNNITQHRYLYIYIRKKTDSISQHRYKVKK